MPLCILWYIYDEVVIFYFIHIRKKIVTPFFIPNKFTTYALHDKVCGQCLLNFYLQSSLTEAGLTTRYY